VGEIVRKDRAKELALGATDGLDHVVTIMSWEERKREREKERGREMSVNCKNKNK
jgi:hypothetical protein